MAALVALLPHPKDVTSNGSALGDRATMATNCHRQRRHSLQPEPQGKFRPQDAWLFAALVVAPLLDPQQDRPLELPTLELTRQVARPLPSPWLINTLGPISIDNGVLFLWISTPQDLFTKALFSSRTCNSSRRHTTPGSVKA